MEGEPEVPFDASDRVPHDVRIRAKNDSRRDHIVLAVARDLAGGRIPDGLPRLVEVCHQIHAPSSGRIVRMSAPYREVYGHRLGPVDEDGSCERVLCQFVLEVPPGVSDGIASAIWVETGALRRAG